MLLSACDVYKISILGLFTLFSLSGLDARELRDLLGANMSI